MLINSKRLYEYPLLCEYNDDYSKKEYFIGSVEKMRKASRRSYITIQVKIEDKQILKYIKEGDIAPGGHLYSSASKYRDIKTLPLGESVLEIENKNVDKTLEISYLLVVTKDIENFTNPNFNMDYKNCKFKVETGNIVAVGNVEKVFIEKDINELEEELKNNNNEELESRISILKYQLEGIEYRLRNDIAPSYTEKSTFVSDYINSATTYTNLNKDESKYLKRAELITYRETVKEYKEAMKEVIANKDDFIQVEKIELYKKQNIN